MSLRISLLGIVWLMAMILLFITPIDANAPVYFSIIPARAIIHFFMFWGFAHIWLGNCKKQIKHDTLRRIALPLIFSIGILIAVSAEVTAYLSGISSFFNYWNIIFGILGTATGILSFRLLYASCY